MNAKNKPGTPKAQVRFSPAGTQMDLAWQQALGRITPGFVHDVNNCLAGILSISETALLPLRQTACLKEELTLIKEGASKASQLLKTLMRLHHEEIGKTDFLDLNALAQECHEVLHHVFKRRLELNVRLAPDPLPVVADAVELKRVIIHLACIVADNMEETGRMTFETVLHAKTPVYETVSGALPADTSVSLGLTDNGPILPKATIDGLLKAKFSGDTQKVFPDMQFALIARAMQNAHGAICLEHGEGAGNALRLVFPKASLES